MKDETAINSYELTLTPNYVSDWNFNDALRELIQNGTDQEVLDPDNEFQIDYSQKEKVLRLKNRKSVLKINTLLLGRSSKANNEDTVGQFGEGYKIAALVLNRLGKTFTIYNNEKNEVWESRFKNSEKWLEKILCFYVSKRKTDNHGLCIEVGNVTQGEFNDLYKVWLHLDDCDYSKAETKYGEIILDEAYAGEVYVNGLFVDCNSDLKYGYNFKPKYIRLERDRKTCDTWNVEDTTSLMIAEAMGKGRHSDGKSAEDGRGKSRRRVSFRVQRLQRRREKSSGNADRIIRYTKPAAILCAGRFTGGYKES